MSKYRCHGRNTGPRCAALREPWVGGVIVIIARTCHTTRASYVLSPLCGLTSRFNRSTPSTYLSRTAVSAVMSLRVTAAMSSSRSSAALLLLEILREKIDDRLYEVDG